MRRYGNIIRITALVMSLVLYFGFKALSQNESKVSPKTSNYVYIEKVIDGDTLKLTNGRKIRLIGVDTPEVHYSQKLTRDSKQSGKDIKAIQKLGERAAAFTRELCLGKKVRLELDVLKKDKYKRILAYVYLEDGTFVNAKIIEEGYGQVMTIPPNVKYAGYFLRLQKEARENNRGLWKE